ncbi:hypothetical protein [Sphingomonas sp. SAFR-052]|uniref:hypothetical protein n=1 Tax=Sphingomonas sp. SAFR-052 TaxID=3436867 RepID=UPI003F821D24
METDARMTAPVSQVLSEADVVVIGSDHLMDAAVMERLFAERDHGLTIYHGADEPMLVARMVMIDPLLDHIRSPWLGSRKAKRSGKPAFNVLRGEVTHIVTPDPISKRKARRLRGRAAALAKEQGR